MQAQRYPEKYIMKQHFSEWSFVAGTRRAICHMKACMQLTFRKGNLRPQPLNSPHKNNQHWSQTHTKEDTTGSAITCSFTCVMRLNWHIAVAHTSDKHVRGHLFIDESAPGFWGDVVEWSPAGPPGERACRRAASLWLIYAPERFLRRRSVKQGSAEIHQTSPPEEHPNCRAHLPRKRFQSDNAQRRFCSQFDVEFWTHSS